MSSYWMAQQSKKLMMIMKQQYQNRRYLISSHDVIVLNQLHEGVPSGKPTCKGAKETTV